MLHIRTFALLAISAATSASFAIVIRHDRDDAKYQELAKQFKAYGDVVEAGSTLVDPEWLLTAGHVAVEITPYTSFASVGGKEYAIDRIIFHPDYIAAGYRGPRDVALLHLAEPVKGVEPVSIYRKGDELNQVVTFFGRGMTGNGETGPTKQDSNMRGATNLLELVNDNSVFFRFDEPASESVTVMEGISGPGDSGGPALLKVDGKWAIAGISSANQTSSGKGVCQYNTIEVYARVSTVASWIDETMKARPTSSIVWKFSKSWPLDSYGQVGKAMIEAFNTGDHAEMEEFNQKFRAPQVLASRTAEQRKAGYLERFAQTGKLKAVEFATDPRGRTMTLLRNEKGEHFQLSLYFLNDEEKGFEGYWIGRGMPRPIPKDSLLATLIQTRYLTNAMPSISMP